MYNMVVNGGSYDLGQVPGTQQNQRVAFYAASNTYVHRTAPFVNSHDTFRPILNGQGNYVGWNTGQQLGGHIEPNDVRLSAAYAINLAVDGNPHIFMEDLFDLAYTGRRFTHLPTSATELPVRSDLANLIWCHQNLNFKDGAYFVRHQSPDHLVFERGNRALISINDQFSTWQNATVTTNFAPGTVLKDYSGANGTATRTVGAGGQVSISTPPCDGTASQGRRGYAVWAPVGQDNNSYNPPRAALTTQEWELADDLGDSNCRGLGQGGRLPDNSTAPRVAGKVFARAGRPLTYTLYPETTGNQAVLTVGVYDLLGNRLSNASGTTAVSGTYTPTATGWLVLKARNATATQAGQRAYLQVSYESPAQVDTRDPLTTALPPVAVWGGGAGTPDPTDCRNWEGNQMPTYNLDVYIPAAAVPQPVLTTGTLLAQNLTVAAGATLTAQAGATVQLFGDLTNNGTLAGTGTYLLNGSAPQHLGGSGPLQFGTLAVDNSSDDVILDAPATVLDTLQLVSGRLALGSYDLNLTTARVRGGSASSYVLTANTPASGGYCLRQLTANSAALFPVGSAAGYAPLTYTTNTANEIGVRTFEGVLANGNSGGPFALAHNFVNRTWALTSGPTPGGFPGSAVAQWNASDEGPRFQRAQSAAFMHAGSWQLRSGAVAASGTGPYTAAFANIPAAGFLAVGNFTALASRAATQPALVQVYPNPTTGQVRLSAATASGPVSLRLTTLLGQDVLPPATGTLAEVQARLNATLPGTAPGVYLLVVQVGQQTQHLRLVRE
jgi:hypothetical protein